jgi:hypothetical protein
VVVVQQDGTGVRTLAPDALAQQARGARSQIENALGPDVQSWPWSIGASRLLDLLIVLEEVGA